MAANIGTSTPVGAKQAYKPSFSGGAQAYNPNSAGTSIYDQYQNAPDWLQQYVEGRMLNEGQSGYYDPALQARDLYQGLSQNITDLYQNYGEKDFLNPYFSKNNNGPSPRENVVPFGFDGQKMSMGQATGYGANTYRNNGTTPFKMYGKTYQMPTNRNGTVGYIDPISGKRVQTGTYRRSRQ